MAETSPTKPRYPAKVFHRLRSYPILHCQNPKCGRQLTPRYTLYQGKQHRLESITTFKNRRYCGNSCSGQARWTKPVEPPKQAPQEPTVQPLQAPEDVADEPKFRAIETKTCVECQKMFIPKSPNQKTCSGACSSARNVRIARERRQAEAKPKPAPEPKPEPKQERVLESRSCIECGELFEPKSYNQRVCGPECRERRAERLQGERRPKAERTCSECGQAHSGRGGALTCSDACRDARKARLKPQKPVSEPVVLSRADEIRAKLDELDKLWPTSDEVARALIMQRQESLKDELWRLTGRAA